jgi:capsular polysaccharide biosynthesis protein
VFTRITEGEKVNSSPVSTNAGNSRNTGGNHPVNEIDLAEVAGAIWKKKGFVILFAFLGACLALVITVAAIRPTYRSSLTAYINNHSTNSENNIDSLNSADTAASQSLAQTYAVIMASRPVVEDALKQAKLSYSYEDVAGCISTSIQTNTQLVTLNVTMENAQEAKTLADAIADIAPDYISDIVEGSSMKIVSSPVLATSRYSPSYSKNTVTGLLIGLLLAIAIVVIQDLTDDRIRSAEELERKFGISIIGTIPDFSEASRNKDKYGYYYGGRKTTASGKSSK